MSLQRFTSPKQAETTSYDEEYKTFNSLTLKSPRDIKFSETILQRGGRMGKKHTDVRFVRDFNKPYNLVLMSQNTHTVIS